MTRHERPQKVIMTDLIKIGFHGDELWAVKGPDGRGWAVVKRICEILGVDADTQAKKLRKQRWATTVIKTVVAEDGKIREMACLDIDSVPMWLATIHASKVRPEVREMLVRLQCEARDVLAAHFLRRGESQDEAILALTKAVLALATRVSAIEHKDLSIIGIEQHRDLMARFRRVSKLRHLAGFERNERAARRTVLNKLGHEVGWGMARGCSWSRLPLQKLAPAIRKLEELESDAMRAIELRGGNQQVLPFARR